MPVKAVYLGYSDLLAGGGFDATVRAAADAGYNLILLAFWLSPEQGADPYSAADYWQKLGASTQQQTVAYVHSKGGRVTLALGGSSYVGYQANGGAAYGAAGAAFAKANLLDGVDFDMENFTGSFGTPSGLTKQQSLQWLLDASIAARNALGADAIITHAPQAPYFNQEFSFGYLDFWKLHPPINFFLVQYYNQGPTYLDYTTQFVNCDNFHPGTAVKQLADQGVPLSVIVVGKLTQASDGEAASWVPPSTLGQWAQQAEQQYGWTTGFSTWQWHSTGSPTSAQWIAAVYPPSSRMLGDRMTPLQAEMARRSAGASPATVRIGRRAARPSGHGSICVCRQRPCAPLRIR